MLAKLGFHHLDIDTKYEKLLFVEQFTIDSVVSKHIMAQLVQYYNTIPFSWKKTYSTCM